MKLTPKLKFKIEKYKDNVIIVEGINDKKTLESAGFSKVFLIHQNKKSIRETLEEISALIKRNDKVSILTDLDKIGNEFNKQVTAILQELGFNIDQSFRKLLIKANISHIEGISNFLEKVNEVKFYAAFCNFSISISKGLLPLRITSIISLSSYTRTVFNVPSLETELTW